MSSNNVRARIASAALIGLSMLAGPAAAEYNGSWSDVGRQGASYGDWADVVHVEPIHRTVQVSTPREECWDEPVKRYRTYAPGYGHGPGHSYTSTILGGIIGGVVGNQFGGGSGNTVLTAAGALLGGSVGRDIQRHHDYHRRYASRESYTTYERRCEVTHTYHEETRVDGYRVDYEYNGKRYSTTTDQHPGDRIRVNVRVTPAG